MMPDRQKIDILPALYIIFKLIKMGCNSFTFFSMMLIIYIISLALCIIEKNYYNNADDDDDDDDDDNEDDEKQNNENENDNGHRLLCVKKFIVHKVLVPIEHFIVRNELVPTVRLILHDILFPILRCTWFIGLLISPFIYGMMALLQFIFILCGFIFLIYFIIRIRFIYNFMMMILPFQIPYCRLFGRTI
jgi:hypothetical protein